jgi:uncharacterized Tic20 family protein
MTQPPPAGAPEPVDPQQPAPGYIPPAQPGYIPPPAAPPAGFNSSEEKTWALVATFGAAAGTLISCGVLAVVGPLIAYLAKGKEPGVRRFALPALNFFLPISAASLVVWILRTCTSAAFNGAIDTLFWLLFTLVLAALWIAGIVFGILAGTKANNGEEYKYPFSLNLIK